MERLVSVFFLLFDWQLMRTGGASLMMKENTPYTGQLTINEEKKKLTRMNDRERYLEACYFQYDGVNRLFVE